MFGWVGKIGRGHPVPSVLPRCRSRSRQLQPSELLNNKFGSAAANTHAYPIVNSIVNDRCFSIVYVDRKPGDVMLTTSKSKLLVAILCEICECRVKHFAYCAKVVKLVKQSILEKSFCAC